MKCCHFLFFLVLSSISTLGQTQKNELHTSWNNLLKISVSENKVDYAVFQSHYETLDIYIKALENNVATVSNTNKKAFYINAYNAITIKLILDNLPLNSIKDLKNPWGKKRFTTGNKKISLEHIEHSILRKTNDPRIHFAINCASISCPPLVNFAFSETEIDKQLDQVTKAYCNSEAIVIDSKNNAVKLSKIFKWYKKDFISSENSSVIEFINTYREEPIPDHYKVEYQEYNWDLNDVK